MACNEVVKKDVDDDNNEFVKTCTARNDFLLKLTQLLSVAKDQHKIPNFNVIVNVDANNNRGEVLRNLFAVEIETLQGINCRCRCMDWSKIRLVVPNKTQHLDLSRDLQDLVSDTAFDGDIIFNMVEEDWKDEINNIHNDGSNGSSSDDWRRLPPGIHSNLMVCDSIFKLKSCRVYRNSLISKTYVGTDCLLLNCGHLSASRGHIYGMLDLSVGPETGGGRKLQLTSEHTMMDVCHQLRDGISSSSSSLERKVSSATTSIQWNVFSSRCVVRDTTTILNVYLHDDASIQAATSVSNATLLPESIIGNSCTASNVLLQWNSSIVDHSIVSDSILMEQAHCGPSSIVASTVLGPDVHTSAGEVHASIIGPNSNAHHQSLVISVLWPLGRGNVGYGANVGSNHTGRLPDQETASGEGTFWGLSCVIKFPVDLTFAPYSIVAAGTALPPQRVCMPFSLIVGGQSDGHNEIIPGWVLQSSPYTLARSEKKFATRRKAKRHHFYTGWKIFRPDIIEMCSWARKILDIGADTTGRIQGVGANKLTDRARQAGIRSYTDCIQRYVLHGLLTWLLHKTNSGKIPFDMNLICNELLETSSSMITFVNPIENVEWPAFPWDMTGLDEWLYQRKLLLEEFPIDSEFSDWVEGLLLKLAKMEQDFARRILKSKKRDDSRGAKTIPGYKQSHVAAENDPVIVEAQTNADRIASEVSGLLSKTLLNARSRL